MNDFAYWLEKKRKQLSLWEEGERLSPGFGNRQREKRRQKRGRSETFTWEDLLGFLLPVVIIVYDALVLTKLWAWFFLVPFGAPELRWSTACGLLTAWALVVGDRNSGNTPNKPGRHLLVSVMFATVLLACGALFHFVF